MKTLVVILALAACSKSADTPQAKRGAKLEYPVDIAALEAKQMQYTVTAPGTLDAFQQVQITARVSGAVDKVMFAEGQAVKQSDVLVTIDSERYDIAVSQAQTGVSKAEASLKAAQAALDRRLEAQSASPGLVPGEEIEQKKTAVDTAKADLDGAKQALRVAQLNLRDSSVRTPIGGVVQTRTVQQGQYLQPGAVMATIVQKEPMLLRFQVSAQDAPRLQPGMVVNLLLKESTHTYTAKITLVSDVADSTTRMVPITAEIDSTDHKHWLRPGAFCEVTIPVGNARQGIVVPTLAVQPTEKGNVVYVVDDKSIAHAKVVELGMHTAEGGVELTRGVAVGDKMVVRGIDPLTDGAPVKVKSTITLEQALAPAQPATAGSGDAGGSGTGSGTGTGTGEAGSGSGSGHHRREKAP